MCQQRTRKARARRPPASGRPGISELLTGLPLGPSSPGGPLGPGGPAAPEGPDSPFSPRSPLGPWRERPASVPSEPAPVSHSAVLASGQPPCLHGKASALGVGGGRHAGPSGSPKLLVLPSPWWPLAMAWPHWHSKVGLMGPPAFWGPWRGPLASRWEGLRGPRTPAHSPVCRWGRKREARRPLSTSRRLCPRASHRPSWKERPSDLRRSEHSSLG